MTPVRNGLIILRRSAMSAPGTALHGTLMPVAEASPTSWLRVVDSAESATLIFQLIDARSMVAPNCPVSVSNR